MDKKRIDEWNRLFINFATDVANMSRAVRLKVGAVAVRDNHVVAIGYNGTPKGEDNCCEEMVEELNAAEESMKASYNPSDRREWIDGKMYVLRTKTNVLHAEENLIKFAKENDINLKDCTLYTTHSPCFECSQKILYAGIKTIVYKEQFRVVSHLGDLVSHGVTIRQWKN